MQLIDTPGLDDSEGAIADCEHIKDATTFLMGLADPVAHVFVLTVNFKPGKLTHSVSNMLDSFRRVFDQDGTKRFVEYVSVVFTHVPFANFAFEDGNTLGGDEARVDKDAFEAAFKSAVE